MHAAPSARRRRRRPHRRLVAVCSLFILGQLVGAAAATDRAVPTPTPLDAPLSVLEQRLTTLEGDVSSLRDYHASSVAPIEAFLAQNAWDWPAPLRFGIGAADAASTWPRTAGERSEHIRRVAIAVVLEGARVDIDPRLLASVMLVENPWLDPFAESPVGAIGLMQVMPFHAGSWDECEPADLTHVESNVCHGASVLAATLKRSRGDLDRALLRYNGCLHGAYTRDCHTYPSKVYAFAGADWIREIVEGRPGLFTKSAAMVQ